jgi:hypothetical protein
VCSVTAISAQPSRTRSCRKRTYAQRWSGQGQRDGQARRSCPPPEFCVVRQDQTGAVVEKTAPCRLFVILARRAPAAVVLRRAQASGSNSAPGIPRRTALSMANGSTAAFTNAVATCPPTDASSFTSPRRSLHSHSRIRSTPMPGPQSASSPIFPRWHCGRRATAGTAAACLLTVGKSG